MASSDPTLAITEETPRSWRRAAEAILAATNANSLRTNGVEPRGTDTVWLVARRGAKVVGTCRGELVPDQTAAVFPPTLGEGEPLATGRSLLHALEMRLTRKNANIRFLQAVVGQDCPVDGDFLNAAGFQMMGELLQMTCAAETADQPGESKLEFEPFDGYPASRLRLSSVFDKTCHGTRDFPELANSAPQTESLDGYRNAGRFGAEWWQIVKLAGKDVGCLLVNKLHQPDVCQLAYCGLIPGVRNRGLGAELVRHGKRFVAIQGAKRLVLSVDKRNFPAIRAYQACGFLITDQCLLFVKRRTC